MLWVRDAAADTPQSKPPAPYWYGWQTLISDAASITTFVLAEKEITHGSRAVPIVSATVGYFLVPPILHWARGNTAKGFGSLGLRSGAALLTVGTLALCSEGGSCPVGYIGLTMMGLAIPIDAFALARDPAPEPDQTAGIGPFHELALTPLLPDARGRKGLALSGRF
jgi:hypothetical protein